MVLPVGVVPPFLALACSAALLFSRSLPCAAPWDGEWAFGVKRLRAQAPLRGRRTWRAAFWSPAGTLPRGSSPCLRGPTTFTLFSSITIALWVQDRHRLPVKLASPPGSGGGSTVSARCRLVAQRSYPSCAGTLPLLPSSQPAAAPAHARTANFRSEISRY